MASDNDSGACRSSGIDAREVGFIGLGRMGGNMVSRILKAKTIRVRVWDRDGAKIEEMENQGALAASGLEEITSRLHQRPKVIFMMLPAGEATEDTFQALLTLLGPGSIIIDGGNSNWRDTTRRHGQSQKSVPS